MWRKIILFSSLAIILLIPSAVYACRCKMPSTAWSYKKAGLILVAKAESVVNSGDEMQSVELNVSQAWKQNSPTSLKIIAGGKVCGYFFEEGKEYVIYLTKNENGEWVTANCVGNKATDDPKLPLIAELARQDKTWLKKNGKKGLLE